MNLYPHKTKTAMMLSIIMGFALMGTAGYGQGNANIVGTVTDPSGAVVANAKITITEANTGVVRTTTTNGTGNYSVPALPNGTYEVTAEAQGFNKYEAKNITVDVNQTVRADARLKVGDVGQSVTIEANAIQVQADTSDVSQTITSDQIANLSTNGRNILQLTALVPGAASNMPDFDLPGAQFQNRAVQFNGMRSDNNNWVIDGGEAYDRGGGGILIVSPSQDALEQFTIQTSNYAADLGNSSGGMISMAVKSGTRQFHGSAWEYDRNDALNSYSYFLKQQTNPKKAELRYNAFGFNIGGPVQFKSSKPKTFFFYNMEWRREVQGGAIHNLAPTSAEYSGSLAPLGHIYVPKTTDPTALAKYAAAGLTPGQEFPNDTIPARLINANAAGYIKSGYLLTPNDTSGQYYISSANTRTNFREEIARVDHHFTDKFAVMGHLIYDSVTQNVPIVAWTGNTFPTIGSIETVPSWAGVVRATYTIKPSLLNEIAYNENGNDITISNTGLWKAPSSWSTTPLFGSANTTGKIPAINISGGPIGLAMDSGNWPWQNWWRSNQIKDDVSWNHGSHNFRFGFAWLWTTKKQETFVNVAGSYGFNGNATGCSGPPNCPASTNGLGLADFLLGDASSFSQAQLQDFVNIAFNSIDSYAMDDWRVNHRLTLNLGLRWEGLPHAYDQNNRLSNFYPNLYDPNQKPRFIPNGNGAMDTTGPGFTTVSGIALSNVPFYLNGVGLAGRNGIPRGLVDNHWHNLAPRIGFAYDVYGEQKTILRGGVGMFYERNGGNEEYNMGSDPPFSNSSSTTLSYLDNPAVAYTNGASAGKSPTTPQGFTGIQSNLPISTVYQYNLGIQQQLRSNMVFTIGYVGNSSAHLSQQQDINTLLPGDIVDRTNVCGTPCGGTPTNANLYRPYLGFGGINLIRDEGNGHYHGLQSTFRTAGWHNLSFSAAYTYSHAWDVVDGQLFNPLDDPMNPGRQYGTAGFDRRHIFVANFDYMVPVFEHSGRLLKSTLGGWTISGITTMESGNPFSVSAGANTLGFGGNTTNRANINGALTYPHTIKQWFNPTVFSQPAPLQWGNAHRNLGKGLGRDNWNLSLYKDFRFTERTGFQFRAESFNTWNHTQFNAINTGVLTGNSATPYSSTAGALTGTYDPRVFQFGGKLYF